MSTKQNLEVCHMDKIKQAIKTNIQNMKKILELLLILFLSGTINLYAQDLSRPDTDSASSTNQDMRPVQPVAPMPTAPAAPATIPTPPGPKTPDNSYKTAKENFNNGKLEVAINELNTNCIPHISTGNALIYKAYKLLIDCYKKIDKDGTAKSKLIELSGKVGKNETTVQEILDDTPL